MQKKRWVVGGAVVALALASVVALRAVHAVDERPNLIIPAPLNQIVFGVPGWMYPKFVAGGGPVVCLDGAGSVHVDSISALRGTLKIRNFSLVPIKGSPPKPTTMTGDRVGTIESSGLPPNPKALTIPCKAQHFYELLLELWASPMSARAEGLTVGYTRGNGTKGVLEIPSYTIIMCADKSGPYC